MGIDQVFLAALFGLLSFISPCVLPMVPAYISLMSGLSVQDLKGESKEKKVRRGGVLLHSIMFILGFADVFVLLFYVFKALGLIIPDFPMWLNLVGGFVVLVFGLHMMGILRIGFLNSTVSANLEAKRMSLFGSFILGFSFALGWSPCTGPFLASIMTMAMTPGATAYWGLLLILFYVLGLGIPFFLTGLATRLLMGVFGWIKSHYKIVELVSGGLLVLMAAVLLSDPILKWTTGQGTGGIAMISNALGGADASPEASVSAQSEETTATGVADYSIGKATVAGEKIVPEVGKPLPSFVITQPDGKEIKVPEDYKGKQVIFVDFWGTWCPSCVAEMPEIIKLQEKYRKDIQVIGISVRSQEKDIHRKAKKIAVNYPLPIGDDIADAYGVTAFPTAIFVNRDGVVTDMVVGEQTGEQFEAMYEKAMSGSATKQEVNWNIFYIFLGLHVIVIVVVLIRKASKKKDNPEAA